jgi:drug/metabolite transporter (DMT)-like permease
MAQAQKPELTGILLALGGGVMLSLNDLAIKFLSNGYALHQIILIRAFISLIIVFAVIRATRTGFAQLITRRPRAHLFRVLIVMVSNVTYFLGLAVMPLADAVATAFIAPILVTLMSAVILGERVGPHRWAAVAIGLCGVLVMVRPTTGALQPAAMLVLISALCYAGSHMMTRRMRETESAMTLNFYVQIGFIIVSACMGLWAGDGHLAAAHTGGALEFLFRPWIMPPLSDWPAFIGTGLAVGIGGLMMSQAYRTSEAALIAPFEYIGMPMAILWGLLVFGTWPDSHAWAGIALICGAGFYTLLREGMRRKDVDVAAPSGDI